MISEWYIGLLRRLRREKALVTPWGEGRYTISFDAFRPFEPDDLVGLNRFIRLASTKGTDAIKIVAGSKLDSLDVEVSLV